MNARRRFIEAAVAAVLWQVLSAGAQSGRRLPRVALVFNDAQLADMAGPDPVNPFAREFVHALRDLGYAEGRNIVIERRSAQGRHERLPALMQELVALPADVIVAIGAALTAAQQATTQIPIVALASDPLESGLVTSLARPGGNITGVSGELGAGYESKLMQLLREAAPQARRIAVLEWRYVDARQTPGVHRRRQERRDAAQALGAEVIEIGADREEDLDSAFAAIVEARADALVVGGTSINYAHRRRIADFAEQRRLPAIYSGRAFVESGGLMSYASADRTFRRAAAYVDKIIKGAKPADLPFELPMRFELVVNLKAARAIGLSISQSVLLRANEVIE